MDKLKKYKTLYNDIKKAKIKGLGPKTTQRLYSLNIKTIKDLLYYFPRTYEDRRNVKEIQNIKPDDYAVVKGEVIQKSLNYTRNGNMFKILLSDQTSIMEVIWFRMPYLKGQIHEGDIITVIGKVKQKRKLQMINPEFSLGERDLNIGEILPVYGLTKGLNQKSLQKILKNTLKEYGEYLYEILPKEIIKKYKLIDRFKSIENIHFPKDAKSLEDAKRRLTVEELLVLEMGILKDRFKLEYNNEKKYELEDKKKKVKMFLDKLNFELTGAQKRVITEIHKDLNSGRISNRLLQGDVGSGKTVVAIVILIYMVENGYQGAFMAPTGILAEQHFISMVDVLRGIGIKVEILTGNVIGQKREEILNRTKQGDIDILVGTHALIEDNVKFSNLGYIIIDEQHRFGVEQRQKLREKGIIANLLVMSATPIPRSLALSIYGDLDISIIDEMPPGRKSVKTKWIKAKKDIKKTYNFIDKKLGEGRQAYIVAPLIEDSEKVDLKSVKEIYEKLQKSKFKKYNIELLHGQQKSDKKNQIMSDFKIGKTDILVSTVVIEVGVNVANASVMVILDAHRFGLAQLHQLRGRVGRGKHQSYCFLISNTDNENSQARLEIMEKTTDGFEIAQEDLKLRKPGEILGTRQSGISDLNFTDITRDVKTIKMVRDEVIGYLKAKKGNIDNEILEEELRVIEEAKKGDHL
ncbi:MAG: ATP-dependent DNA helicase RecG [Fusobacteriota bacterium]